MPRKQDSPNVLADNWYLILAVVVLLVGGIVAAIMSSREGDPPPTGVIGSVDGVNVVRLSDEQTPGTVPTVGYQDLPPDERDQKYIEDYQEKLQANPDDEEAAGTMMSLAVVYRRLHQYDDAAIVLEDLLEKFPDSPNARTAIIQLPEIYQESGDISMARQSYQRMMEKFPPESQEYQWAQKRYSEL